MNNHLHWQHIISSKRSLHISPVTMWYSLIDTVTKVYYVFINSPRGPTPSSETAGPFMLQQVSSSGVATINDLCANTWLRDPYLGKRLQLNTVGHVHKEDMKIGGGHFEKKDACARRMGIKGKRVLKRLKFIINLHESVT